MFTDAARLHFNISSIPSFLVCWSFFFPPGILLVLATHQVNVKPQSRSIASCTRISWGVTGVRAPIFIDSIRHLSPDNRDSRAREISKSEVKWRGRSDAFGLDISLQATPYPFPPQLEKRKVFISKANSPKTFVWSTYILRSRESLAILS